MCHADRNSLILLTGPKISFFLSKVGVHSAVIGRYERDEVESSIEMAAQIATALEVSLDYLVGNTDLLLDQTILDRIMDIQKLNDQNKTDAFKLLDMFLRDVKARHA